MVFVITGTAESDRNSVGRLLADDLGWEFVDGENLHPPANLDAREADPIRRIETLSAAIRSWLYKWQDVVVSWPMLTEGERGQLSEISKLVKIVCLNATRATGAPLLERDRPVRIGSSEFPDGWAATREPGPEALPLDLYRQVEEIIKEIVGSPK